MKALFLFTATTMILGYFMMSMVHNQASANTYKQGIVAYVNHYSKK